MRIIVVTEKFLEWYLRTSGVEKKPNWMVVSEKIKMKHEVDIEALEKRLNQKPEKLNKG